MATRTILIAAGIALASTLGIAQVSVQPPAATTSTTGATTTGAASSGVNSVTTTAAPGVSNVPVGINAVGAGSGTVTSPVPTAIIVPTNTTGFVGPSQSFPLINTPSVTFVNSADGTTTVPVVSYGSSASMPNSSASAANAANANTGAAQTADLNLGNVGSISELYGGDNRSVAEIARQYKQRRNGVQNARVYTNADIARIRQQEGGGSSAVPANDQQGAMPASDQSAEQDQSTTPQVQQPAVNQKPSPFAPKK
jgi:hypothetical protein